MSRRATVSIRVDDGLVLRPASPSVLTELQEAFEETWPEVSRAMPWIDIERDLKQQILSFWTKLKDWEGRGFYITG